MNSAKEKLSSPQGKYVIIHGHFYQPPREGPWSGIIDQEETAAPHDNWNSRITAECYAANGASRVLDSKGRITAIINNYKTLSFNFGPTLLSWLEEAAPSTYGRILEADRWSVEHWNGHGNALAQSYNHTILPLDRPEDARAQIRWGLVDFHSRFQRKAEGMWLPECAVNEFIIDLLIEENLSFVVLSPWQAQALKNQHGDWEDLGGPAPCNRPFVIRRPGGSIGVFFYHPELASAISFGNLLTSKDKLEGALRKALEENGGPLVTVATDGEIYGHHEPFGDMCLAALINQAPPDLVFTNYAAYLEVHPPQEEVRLKPGDEQMGTSWSCSHGVGRWMRDCGCSTGAREGEQQAWRGPFRGALDHLREKAEESWKKAIAGLPLTEPQKAREGYGEVLARKIPPMEYARRVLGSEAREKDLQILLRLLEGYKCVQFMYTSCGWFFADLAGLEPLQNMRYASRAASLHQEEAEVNLEELLMEDLAHAPCFLPAQGTGKDLYQSKIQSEVPSHASAGILFFLRDLYNLPGRSKSHWGQWEGRGLSRKILFLEGGHVSLKGEVDYYEKNLGILWNIPYRAVVQADLTCSRITVEIEGETISVALKDMPSRLRVEIAKNYVDSSENQLSRFLGHQVMARIKDHYFVTGLNLPFETPAWHSLELALHFGPVEILRKINQIPFFLWDNHLDRLEWILSYADSLAQPQGRALFVDRLELLVSRILQKLQMLWHQESYEALVKLLHVVWRHGYVPVRPYVQNTVYTLIEETFSANKPHDLIAPDLEDLLVLGALVNINPKKFTSSGQA